MSTEEQLRVILKKKDALAEVNQERVKTAVAEAGQDRFPYLHHIGQVIQLVNKGNSLDVKSQGVDEAKNLAANIVYKEIYCKVFNK